MKKTFLIVFLFIVAFLSSYSQTNNKLWGGLEIGYGLSLSDRGDLYNISYDSNNKMSMSSLRGIVGYYILPNLSLGGAIGLNSYTKPQLNTVPLSLDLRFHPLIDNLDLVLNSNLGYIIATSESDEKGKLFADLSVGYKVLNISKVAVIPAIGYNYIGHSV